ncbi:hypothetical protein [Streptomyces sp. DvalAA-19]|uniref:hypothetical protein n=1 Tax=Streptomyces sp. DvalAA-19 TaxID=1839761 RepID=UPI00081B7A09|nr:hypothetical protein [Streptomyces sp. DvalAA-19]SCE00462.1 hypothetical protein GA0115244_115358 [Streptomyces sp. DvalAA-19]
MQQLCPVGPDYFEDQDRDYAANAGVELINALRKLGVDLEGIEISPPCGRCSPLEYVLDLGPVRPADALRMAAKINDCTDELQRLRTAGTAAVPPKVRIERKARSHHSTL